MSVHLFRLVPFFLCLIVLNWFLPKIYLRATIGENRNVSGQYSPITQNFILWENTPTGLIYRNANGEKLSQIEARKLLPFFFHQDGLKHNLFPLHLEGQQFSYQDALTNHHFRIYPGKVFKHRLPLYFLLESAPQTAELSLPDDVLLFEKDSVRFINCKTGLNKKEKSEIFTRALLQSGVTFPVQLAANNPEPQKPFDEGLFFIDGQNKLFQLKQIKGKPFCRFMKNTFSSLPLALFVDENLQKKYYGQIVTDKNIFLIGYDQKLIRLPLPNYEAANTQVQVRNTPFYKTLIAQKNDIQKPTTFIAADKFWQQHSVRKESCRPPVAAYQKCREQGLSLLGFFRISQFQANKAGTVLRIELASFPLIAAASNLLCVVLLFLRRFHLQKSWFEMLSVAVFGLPGLISLLIFGPLCQSKKQKFC